MSHVTQTDSRWGKTLQLPVHFWRKADIHAELRFSRYSVVWRYQRTYHNNDNLSIYYPALITPSSWSGTRGIEHVDQNQVLVRAFTCSVNSMTSGSWLALMKLRRFSLVSSLSNVLRPSSNWNTQHMTYLTQQKNLLTPAHTTCIKFSTVLSIIPEAVTLIQAKVRRYHFVNWLFCQ